MANQVLIWTCVVVFALTALITLLSLVGWVTIPESYRNKLFYILIVEIVTSGVLVFKNSLIVSTIDIVRITNPSSSFTPENKIGTSLFINGVCSKNKDVTLIETVFIAGKSYAVHDIKIDNRSMLTSFIKVDTIVKNAPLVIVAKLIKNNKQIDADTVSTFITIQP